MQARTERRKKPRIQGPIAASIWGIDSNGARFDINAFVDNLSMGGLYVRLRRQVSQAAHLSFAIRLPSPSGLEASGMQFTAVGVVRRIDIIPGGAYGLGVEFTGHSEVP